MTDTEKTPMTTALDTAIKQTGAAIAPDVKARLAGALARKDATRSPAEVEAAILVAAARRAEELGAVDRFVARLEDVDVDRVRRTFAADAAREVSDDRYGMIVAAAAEAMILDRTAAELAGTARVLRELDCSDVRALVEFERVGADNEKHAAQFRYEPKVESARGTGARLFLDGSPHRDTLLAALLVKIEWQWSIDPKPAFVTPRGAGVFSLLQNWASAASPE